ncbi:hypothetical protein [Bosea sp. AS-1]|uniref:hypothetical protein n=1 Tax=Bosea sp. AS-1 TaxID=2015316 RepID=UPI000B778AE8|nr:hypothetical protein [Bosea sp. AS-1]
MRAIVLALALMASGSALASQGRCLLVVDGRTYLKGLCPIDTQSDGSFSIGTGPRPSFFAYVTVDKSGTAVGYWNEERGVSHAHSDLGTLTRNGACWVNERAKVCAWR